MCACEPGNRLDDDGNCLGKSYIDLTDLTFGGRNDKG